MNNYKVKTIITSTGERLPLLINTNNNKPDMWCTLYTLTQVRAQGKAAATIKYILQNLSFLKILFQKYEIDESSLIERFKEGKTFQPFELEGFIEDCKFKVDDLLSSVPTKSKSGLMKDISLNSLEKFRSYESQKYVKFIDKGTIANRLRTIRDYIVWLADTHVSKMDVRSLVFLALKDSIKDFKEKIEARIPTKNSNSLISGKEGLSKDELQLLFSIINRNSEENPFRGDFLKSRNEVIFAWLFKFGLRRGELLNVKIPDIDFRKKQVRIIRRADDVADPREQQPNVKTRSRILAIPDKIMEITEHYILNHRINTKGSKKHEYLIVASSSGAPLTLNGLNKISERLRERFPELPNDFSPHTLRHSWNESFSELMDKKDITEEREQQIRNYQMGWKDGSKMAENYSKRHIREKANEAINHMAEDLFKKIER